MTSATEGPAVDPAEQVPGPPEQFQEQSLQPAEQAPAAAATSELAVRPVFQAPALVWRRRALAVRASLPQLARNPVVLGALAAAAPIAARIAVDVVRHLAGTPARGRPTVLAITGQVIHHHVVHHHVVHHAVVPGVPVIPVVPVVPVVLRSFPGHPHH